MEQNVRNGVDKNMIKYISEEAAIKKIKEERTYVGAFSFEEERAWSLGFHQAISFAISDLASLPAADVRENKRGKWEYSIHDEDGLEIVECVCSACHDYKESYAKWLYDDGNRNWFNFCPNCGALMSQEGTL